VEKFLHELTRDEWVRDHWIDVTSIQDTQRRFMRTRARTPDEAAEASRQFSDLSSALVPAKPHGWRHWLGLG
jgi:hypothetical protein